MTKNDHEKNSDRITLIISLLLILPVALGETISYNESEKNQHDYFSVIIGFAGWIGTYARSQRILNRNLFWQFTYIGILIFALSLAKQVITDYNKLSLSFSGIPLFFIGYFRLLVFLFYRKYPNLLRKPTVIFLSKIRPYYQNQGYTPTMKDKLFSLSLFLGFVGLLLGLIMFFRN